MESLNLTLDCPNTRVYIFRSHLQLYESTQICVYIIQVETSKFVGQLYVEHNLNTNA